MDIPQPPESDPSVAYSHLALPLVELASGVDALYLSGRTALPPPSSSDWRRLEHWLSWLRRLSPSSSGASTSAWHPTPSAAIGSASSTPTAGSGSPRPQLPAIRIQPRSGYLHAVGPAAAATRFQQILESECDEVFFSVSRIDLYVDVQGWDVGIEDRPLFVCRAGSVRTYEEENRFTGFEFGRRTTKTVCARIYDKTADVARTGADWWFDIWQLDKGSGPVIRVELEWNRQGLDQFGLSGVDETLAAVGDLWRYGTEEWLTHRSPTDDGNRARWPVSPPWTYVQKATLAHHAIGAERVSRQQRAGSLRRMTPALVGYLVAFAALRGTTGIDDTVSALTWFLRHDEILRGKAFADRIRQRLLDGRFR